MKILVIDDSMTIRKQLANTLTAEGYEVEEASDGLAGLKSAERTHYDLVIVDMNMPHLDGIGFIHRLRRLPAYLKTPVFVLTTESTQDKVQEGRAAGATAWIVKPFKPETLLKGIKKVLL